MPGFDPKIHHRHSIRLKDYDYSQAGVYFVTIVTQGREALFGEVVNGEIRLNRYGEIVQKWWEAIQEHFPNVDTGAFVVMPNHMHGIITIGDNRRGTVPVPQGGETPPLQKRTLGQVIAYFKYQSTKEINAVKGGMVTKLWQRNYYDHIIRNQQDLKLTWLYIESNPIPPNGKQTTKIRPKDEPFVVQFAGRPDGRPVLSLLEAPMFVFTPEDLIKVLLAVVIGGIIGFEREIHSKAAGLRTITLITIGATLFTILSMKFADADRVAANIVSGVGFLGAGVILFAEGKLKGLTTASSIWAAAALGMAIGLGEYILAGTATVVVVVVLALFAGLDRWLDIIGRETRSYELVYSARDGKHEELEALFRQCGMRLRNRKRMKRNGEMVSVWEAEGRPRDHLCLTEKLLADKEIKELRY